MVLISQMEKKERLLEIFGGLCDNVVDLLLATDEEAILRRDIFDRIPKFTWGKGRITLLGDSVHAMRPNLGQGGCMAIEVTLSYNLKETDLGLLLNAIEQLLFLFFQDSYQLALELDKAWIQSTKSGAPIDIQSSLRR